MNYFALDDGELNGQAEVWLDTESTAQAVLALSGGVNKARFVESTTKVQFSSSLKAAIRIGLKSAAGYGITVSAWLPPSLRKCLAGGAQEKIAGSAELIMQAKLNGISEIELILNGSIRPLGLVRTIFELTIDASAEARVAKSVQGSPYPAGVFINAESHEDVRLAAMLESKVQHWLHSIGELRLDSYSSTGVATVELKGSGSIRTGAKVKLDGTASVFIELYSRGTLGGIRYRYLTGDAAINMLSSWSPTGHPEQPDFYIPAQDERVLFATRDDRTLEVPREVA